jgi:hypothetical protein
MPPKDSRRAAAVRNVAAAAVIPAVVMPAVIPAAIPDAIIAVVPAAVIPAVVPAAAAVIPVIFPVAHPAAVIPVIPAVLPAAPPLPPGPDHGGQLLELQRFRALLDAGLIDQATHIVLVRRTLGVPDAPPPAAPATATAGNHELVAEDAVVTSERRLEQQIFAFFGNKAAPCFKADAWLAITGDASSAFGRERIKDLLCEEHIMNKRLSLLFIAAGEGRTPAVLLDPAADILRLAAWTFVTTFAMIFLEEVCMAGATSTAKAAFVTSLRDVMDATVTSAAKRNLLAGVAKLQGAAATVNKATGGVLAAPVAVPEVVKPNCNYCKKGTHLEENCNKKSEDRKRERDREDAERKLRDRRDDQRDRDRNNPQGGGNKAPYCTKCRKYHHGNKC